MGDDKRQIVENSVENRCTAYDDRDRLRRMAIEHLSRYDRKNGLDDLIKASWCLDKLIDEEASSVLAELRGDVQPESVSIAGREEPGMVERPCSEAVGHVRIGYGIGAGEKHDADDSEHGEFGKKGCMKTLYGPVTGFYREGA